MAVATKERILVVEDSPVMASFLKRQLELAGFEVEVATCGSMALSSALARQPDLVILDIGLPDISGYEVCRKLRQLFHPWAIPVLMLTCMNRPVDQLRGFANGADAYMTKPYDPNELDRTIALLLGQADIE